MVKIYFDWNVMAQMKNGLHHELKEVVLNDKKLLIPFSTSHINDIFSSFKKSKEQQDLINSDLDFITQVTNDYCLFNNGKTIIIEKYSPNELFNQNIEDIGKYDDISMNGLLGMFEEDDTIYNAMKPVFDMLKNLPIDNVFKDAFENPESAAALNMIFPGLKDNPTMEGFFESFSKMNHDMNELDTYKDFRKTIQGGSGINRDKIFDDKNPFGFIQKKYDKLGVENDGMKSDDQFAPKWFIDISNNYLKLDIHGYQEDKVNISGGRKETFKNTTEDAFHAAFASTCSFYVINDKKSYKKSKKVFEELGINTVVFKPDEFIEFYNNHINYKSPQDDVKLFQNLIMSENYFVSNNEHGNFRTYDFPYYLFSFFNCIVCFEPYNNEQKSSIYLTQNKPTNWFIIDFEVKMLVDNLLIRFGSDKEEKGPLSENEFNVESWQGRTWEFDNLTLRLLAVNGFVQLYWDIK